MAKWISVKEQLPEYMEDVLCVCVNRSVDTRHLHTGYLHTNDTWQDTYDGRIMDVTHWMPLPNMPNK